MPPPKESVELTPLQIIERAERFQFVDWLKAKGLYSEFDSAPMMQKMHKVWEACGSPVE